MDSGVKHIISERMRQIEKGFTVEHDAEHNDNSLVQAADCYMWAARVGVEWAQSEGPPDNWPWTKADWKPSKYPIRNLEKAGALIAAEIDRRLDADLD